MLCSCLDHFSFNLVCLVLNFTSLILRVLFSAAGINDLFIHYYFQYFNSHTICLMVITQVAWFCGGSQYEKLESRVRISVEFDISFTRRYLWERYEFYSFLSYELNSRAFICKNDCYFQKNCKYDIKPL